MSSIAYKPIIRNCLLSLVKGGRNKGTSTDSFKCLVAKGRFFCRVQNQQNEIHTSVFHLAPEIPKSANTPGPTTVNEKSKEMDSKPGQKFHPPHPTVLLTLQQMEDSMRFHGYSTIRIGGAILLVGGLGVYIFREHIRDKAADEVSTVAYKSLGDVNLKLKAQELAVALLHAILDDQDTQEQTVRFLKDLFGQPETMKALSGLLLAVVNDPDTKYQLVTLLKEALISSLSDPSFRTKLTSNLKILLKDPNTQEGVLSLLKYALSDESLAKEATTFLQKLIESTSVRNASVDLGKKVVEGVVSDDSIQRQAGEAMWSSMSYTVTPKMFWGNSQPSTTNHSEAKSTVAPAEPKTEESSAISQEGTKDISETREAVSTESNVTNNISDSRNSSVNVTEQKAKKDAQNERITALAAAKTRIQIHEAESAQAK